MSANSWRFPLLAHVVANVLTAFRFLAAAAFPVADNTQRIALVVGAAATDLLDGYLARRFRLTSWWGSLFDGLADKAITMSVLITIAFEGHLAIRQMVLVLVRDFAVLGITACLAWYRAWPEFTRMQARMPGKVTTIALFILMLALLVIPSYAYLVYWPTVVISVLAAIDYVLIFLSIQPEKR